MKSPSSSAKRLSPIVAASCVDPATSTNSTVPRNRSGLGKGRKPVTNSSNSVQHRIGVADEQVQV